MIDQRRYDEVVAALYATVADGNAWATALASIRAGFDCSIASLNTGFRHGGRAVERSWSTAPSVSEDWVRRWASVNPIKPNRMKNGDVAFARDLVDPDSLIVSAYYNEFLLPADIPQVMIIRGAGSANSGAVVNILRGRHQPEFGEAELALANRLSGHIVNALATAAMLGWKSWTDLTVSLEAAHDAMVLVDAGGMILHMNRTARALAEARDGIVASARGLEAVIERDGKRLRQAIWQAATAPAPRSGTMLAIERPSHARSLIASVTPLEEQLLDVGIPRPRALIAILDPAHAAPSPAGDLQRLFGLTRREAEIAQALAEGLTIAEAAGRCGVTLVTARNHLARVLRKTQLNRQAELVSLSNGLSRLSEAGRRG